MQAYLLKPALIIPAIVVAICIVVLRHKLLKKHKPSLFLSMILMALSFMGCAGNNPNEEKDEKSRELEETPENAKMSKLQAMPEWATIRALWQEIDKVEIDTLSQPMFSGIYNFSFSMEAADFLKEIDTAFLQLKYANNKNILDSLEIEFLHKLFTARINGMQSGTMLLSHIMPPPTLIKRNKVVFDLEKRIDKLIELKNENILNETEYQKNLENIYTIAANATAYEIIQQHYTYYGFDFLKDSSSTKKIDSIQKQFNNGHNKLVEMLNKNSNNERKQEVQKKQELVNKYFEQLKTKLPFIKASISDFEKNIHAD